MHPLLKVAALFLNKNQQAVADFSKKVGNNCNNHIFYFQVLVPSQGEVGVQDLKPEKEGKGIIEPFPLE